MESEFYGQEIETPQSAWNNTDEWQESTIAKLNNATKGQVFIGEIPYQHVGAMYAWRVTGAFYSTEDTTMSRFRAYDIDGNGIAHPTFGVTWANCPYQIGGGFAYPPSGRNWYVPVDHMMNTPNSGGYKVTMLDKKYPSESLGFGCLNTEDGHHQGLVILFRLFTISSSYPNDIQIP